MTSNPGLTCWKHLISDPILNSFGLKRIEPIAKLEDAVNTLSKSQIPTVEVACFVVSQITPCMSEALLSFCWMLSLYLQYFNKLIFCRKADFIHSLPFKLSNIDCWFCLCIRYWKQLISPWFKSDRIWICF